MRYHLPCVSACVLLHSCHYCCMSAAHVVTVTAVACSPVRGGCLPFTVCCCLIPFVGVSPAWGLSPVFMDLLSLVPLPAFKVTQAS